MDSSDTYLAKRTELLTFFSQFPLSIHCLKDILRLPRFAHGLQGVFEMCFPAMYPAVPELWPQVKQYQKVLV